MSSPPPQSLTEDTLTKLRRLKLLQDLQAAQQADLDPPYRWTCELPDCDGLPHPGWPDRHARTAQRQPDGDWLIWLILTGRGWGKSRTGSETLLDWILHHPTGPDGAPTEWAIVAETFSDVRKICVEGPSGFLNALKRRGIGYSYNKSFWHITLDTGQIVHMLGAADADVGRGLNLSGAWLDELAKWPVPYDTWIEGLAPALRIGQPRVVVTTTPKNIKLLVDWLKRSDGTVTVTRGSTFENAANLSAAALEEMRRRYEGTRIGRQELHGELLEDVEGALWTRAGIEQDRRDWATWDAAVDIELVSRIVVGVDPAVTSGEDADETGIVVAGRDRRGEFWVIADRSGRYSPNDWAGQVLDLYDEHRADRIVPEVNNGGEMVVNTIKTLRPNASVRPVTATRGKRVRAEPIAALYEQHRVHHVGNLATLEDQLVSWTPEEPGSPDRMDALVWALTELSGPSGAKGYLEALVAEQDAAPDRPVSLPGVNTSDYFKQLVG